MTAVEVKVVITVVEVEDVVVVSVLSDFDFDGFGGGPPGGDGGAEVGAEEGSVVVGSSPSSFCLGISCESCPSFV